MTEAEMLEAEKHWCENCCNFDKEHSLPDGYANCKVTNMLTFGQCCGKECKFFDKPAENVIALPNLKYRQTVYMIYKGKVHPLEVTSYMIRPEFDNLLQIHLYKNGFNGCCTADDFGKTVFLSEAEARKALQGNI